MQPSCWGGWRQERTCKHSSSVRTPEAALVSVPRPCRDFISGRTFDAWRRSTRLNSLRTADIPQTLRLMNYARSITIERAEFLSRGTYNRYSRYQRHSCTCIMHACTSVTVVASEIPHHAPKTCWLQSRSPLLGGGSIFVPDLVRSCESVIVLEHKHHKQRRAFSLCRC